MLTNIQPSWISIDQNLETVIIDTTNLTSVFTTQLLFSAQMITFSNNQGSRYTTKNYTSIFVMENTNCELVSAQFKNHLVLNKISNFSFEFEDIEGDNVKIKVGTSSYFSSFVQYLSSDSTNILVMPQQSTENEVDFYFMYRIRRCPVPPFVSSPPCKFGKILVVDHFVEKNLYWKF